MKRSDVELVMVTGLNNNKFYQMFDNEDGTFRVEYGRVGQTTMTGTYPISKWDSKRNEKIRKGYRDVSDLKVETKQGEFLFDDPMVETFYNSFSRYTRDNVSRNYTIATGAVTKAMIVEAQDIINQLVTYPDTGEFNSFLLQLYTVLPRRMGNVKDYLLSGGETQEKLDKLIAKEQDVLDSLESNVITTTTEADTKFTEYLGVSIEQEKDKKVLARIESLINPTMSQPHKIYKVYKITNPSTKSKFDTWIENQNNKRVDLLIHGTRNPNVFSILKSGLLVRPTNAACISGAAYGNGVYHSAHADKSLGYTGYDKDKIFFLQEVHMGNPYTYKGWYRGNDFPLRYEELNKRGYDSTYVEAGNGLRNSEYIVYNSEQTNSSFLVWLI